MDARLFDRRTIKTPLDQFVAGICREAGVRYRGIQSGFGKVPDQVLVDNDHGSTLCLPLPELTADKIREAVGKSNAAWRNVPSIQVTTKRRTVVAGKWVFNSEAADQ